VKAGTSTAILNGVTPAQIDAALGFRPDPQISARVRVFSAVANLSARNPAFPKDGALKRFESLVASHGYSSRNIADAYATLLWTAWQILSGDRLTDAQIRGIHQQVRARFIGTPELRAIPAEMRQQLTEEIAYMVVELTAAMVSGSDSALVRAVPTAALARSMIGVNLADLEVTADSGFRPKRAGP
jgi:hypothetical protein